MEQVSFIAYGDIGSQTGRDITRLAAGLNENRLLHAVYCRGIEKQDLPREIVREPIPFGRAIPRTLSGINRFVIEDFNNRYYSERLFDAFAARDVTDSGIHLHHDPRYIRTVKKGNEMGNKTIVKVTTEYAPAYYRRVEKEFESLGYTLPNSLKPNNQVELQKEVLQECDEIIAISSFVRDSLIEGGFPSNKISIAPLGVSSDYYTNRLEKVGGIFTVLYVGSITVQKGIPHLLRAWENNGWGNDEKAQLILCGNISPTMDNILSKYNFDNIQTPGFVDPREYYQNASVFVFPSLSDGFGKAPLEAMAAGIPVISTDNTGMPDIMSDGKEGYIIPTRDANTLGARLQYLRENPEIRQHMHNNALQTSQRQTWEKHIESVMNTF